MSINNFNSDKLENKLAHHYATFPELSYVQYRVAMFYALGGELKVLAMNDGQQHSSQKKTLERAKHSLNCKNLDELRSIVLLRMLFF